MTTSDSKGLNIGLWAAQAFLALTLIGGAFWKVLTPLAEIAKIMPWAGQVAPGFFYMTAAVDFLGGVGVLLPAVTRIKPGLTSLAAVGVVLLQLNAIVFHFSRGEAANTPFNFFLVGLAVFVAWGRFRKAPIAAKG